MLHSGHIAFLDAAAQHGLLNVAIGSDTTIFDLKGRPPVTCEEERLFMIQSLECVHHAFISRGRGILDFKEDLEGLRPDIFVVNADGDVPAKRHLCESLGIQYLVLAREPHENLAARSTTDLRNRIEMPYRLDLAGGWLDQPFISKLHPGPVITVSLEPTFEFNERSGMASSTRRTAIDLWGPRLPADDPEKLSHILFCCENPPGSQYISGSQDAIGLVYPGVTKSDYDGEYWPTKISPLQDESVVEFIENHVFLKPLGPRTTSYDVMKDTCFTSSGAKALSQATEDCWEALHRKDPISFGNALFRSFEAQISLFPNMTNPEIESIIDPFRETALGWKLSGAGGGGYLVLVSKEPIEHTARISVRRGGP